MTREERLVRAMSFYDWGSEGIDRAMQALEYARSIHKDQKYGTQTYVVHPLEVALRIVMTPTQRIIALLHDTVEDGGSLREINDMFGQIIGDAVRLLTRETAGFPYRSYILLLKDSPDARIVKLSDLICNMSGLLPHEPLVERYSWAYNTLYKHHVDNGGMIVFDPQFNTID